jgi:DNA-binding NtrC family response regulator
MLISEIGKNYESINIMPLHSIILTKRFTMLRDESVILDHKLPKMNGFDVAKEIILINPHQRIIIGLAYSKDSFNEVAHHVGLPLETLQKPFSGNTLLNMLEHTILYEKMRKHLIEIEPVKEAKLRHEQLKAIADLLDKQDDD